MSLVMVGKLWCWDRCCAEYSVCQYSDERRSLVVVGGREQWVTVVYLSSERSSQSELSLCRVSQSHRPPYVDCHCLIGWSHETFISDVTDWNGTKTLHTYRAIMIGMGVIEKNSIKDSRSSWVIKLAVCHEQLRRVFYFFHTRFSLLVLAISS